MAYVIGLPPKNNTPTGSSSWMETKKNYLKIELTPISLSDGALKELINATTGQIAFNSEEGKTEFKKRVGKLGATIKDDPPIDMYVLSEAPFTDTYGNTLENVTLIGQAAESLSQSGIAKLAFGLKASGIDTGNVLQEAINMMSKTSGEQLAPYIEAGRKTFQQAQNKQEVQKAMESVVGKGDLVNMGATLASTAASIVAGNKPIFPKVWWESSFSCGYNFSVRLYNPNPASTAMHTERIVNPLCALLALVLPVESTENGNTYTSPLYVSLKCKGLFNLEWAMITNMSVVRGGDDNTIAFNGRPGIIDIRFGVTPVYDKRMAGGSMKGVNEKTNIEALLDEDKFESEEGGGGGANGENTSAKTNEQPTSSTEPQPRTDPSKMNLQLKNF